MTNKMTPVHWLRIAGAGGVLAALYVAWVAGDASDGHIGVPPQINAAAVVWPAAILATIVIIAGVAKLIAPLRKDLQAARSLLEQTREFPKPRIAGTVVVSQSAAVAQSAEVTEIGERIARRLNGVDHH